MSSLKNVITVRSHLANFRDGIGVDHRGILFNRRRKQICGTLLGKPIVFSGKSMSNDMRPKEIKDK